jgi:hypothetical protein
MTRPLCPICMELYARALYEGECCCTGHKEPGFTCPSITRTPNMDWTPPNAKPAEKPLVAKISKKERERLERAMGRKV